MAEAIETLPRDGAQVRMRSPTCEDCASVFEERWRKGRVSRRCPDCKAKLNQRRCAATKARMRAEVGKPPLSEFMECQRCRATTPRTSNSKRYCDGCREAVNKEHNRQNVTRNRPRWIAARAERLANDPRAKLERRARFVVLATTQSDPDGWAWCDPFRFRPSFRA